LGLAGVAGGGEVSDLTDRLKELAGHTDCRLLGGDPDSETIWQDD